MMQQHFC